MFLMGFLAAIGCAMLLNRSERDDSDPKTGRRSGLNIYTDQRTGMQYIRGGFFGSIIPRLDAVGEQLQCPKWREAALKARDLQRRSELGVADAKD